MGKHSKGKVQPRVVGRTVEGKLVVAGLYRLYETEGIPLDIILEFVRENGLVPCWVSLYREARSVGMKHSRVLSMLEPAVQDVYGQEVLSKVLENFKILHEKNHVCLDPTLPWGSDQKQIG